MAMLGQAALAMWWNMAQDQLAEFEHWHTHEHYPERLGVPGFRRASRWRDAMGGDGIFQMYELEGHAVLSSDAYLARLNAPTPWSTRMMTHHRDMVRSQCSVLASYGGVTARHATTVRLSPVDADGNHLLDGLRSVLKQIPQRAGMCGAHLLKHSPPQIATTAEQKIRGGDAEADWVLFVAGYELESLQRITRDELGISNLMALGAAPGARHDRFQLSYSATPADIA